MQFKPKNIIGVKYDHTVKKIIFFPFHNLPPSPHSILGEGNKMEENPVGKPN